MSPEAGVSPKKSFERRHQPQANRTAGQRVQAFADPARARKLALQHPHRWYLEGHCARKLKPAAPRDSVAGPVEQATRRLLRTAFQEAACLRIPKVPPPSG